MKRFQVPDEIAIRVPPDDMHATVAAIFRALRCSRDDARRCADALLYADVRGIDSHGVSNMMQIYVAMLKQGYVNPAPSLRVLREADATATVDSDRGLGLTIGPQCMDLALEKAERCGIGSVVATNGRHFGAAGYHAARALERDMIGVALTIGGLELVPTFGGEARVGLNPIAIAVPTRDEPPFIFDASMSFLGIDLARLVVMHAKQVVGELGTGKGVVKQLGVVETSLELLDDLIVAVTNVDVLRLNRGLRGLHHGVVSFSRSGVGRSFFEIHLRFEDDPFTGGQAELDDRDDLPGTLSDPHIADCVLARISPIRIERTVNRVRRYGLQVL